MPQIPEQQVTDWNALQVQAARFGMARGFERIYAFRGHYNIAWRLQPTLHRAATFDGEKILPSAVALLELERRLIRRFRQESPNLLPSAVMQSTRADIDWWPLMRHYGAPTRLLDWTMSFYVAAYFAAASEPKSDGVIYVLYVRALQDAMARLHPDGTASNDKAIDAVMKKPDAPPEIRMIELSTALLDRMTAQQGIFMSSLNVATDMEEALETHVPFAVDRTVAQLKIRIPAALKSEVVHQLRGMNITAATLFPGLDGIGRALADTVRYP